MAQAVVSDIARQLADMFKADYPAFRYGRFFPACRLDPWGEVTLHTRRNRPTPGRWMKQTRVTQRWRGRVVSAALGTLVVGASPTVIWLGSVFFSASPSKQVAPSAIPPTGRIVITPPPAPVTTTAPPAPTTVTVTAKPRASASTPKQSAPVFDAAEDQRMLSDLQSTGRCWPHSATPTAPSAGGIPRRVRWPGSPVKDNAVVKSVARGGSQCRPSAFGGSTCRPRLL
jgi:hypothetical protein